MGCWYHFYGDKNGKMFTLLTKSLSNLGNRSPVPSFTITSWTRDLDSRFDDVSRRILSP